MINENEILSPTGVLCVAVPTKSLHVNKNARGNVDWCALCPFENQDGCWSRWPSCFAEFRTDKTGIVWQPKES